MGREKQLKCMRMSLLVFNAIYSISGGILLGLGIWAAVEKLFLSDIIGNQLYSTASYLIIATGAILLLVSLLGCVGICIEVRCMLIAYFLLLLLLFVCLVLSAILAIVFHGEIAGSMKASMKETLVSKYGYSHESTDVNRGVTESWDTTQLKFNCCAVDAGDEWNYMIYRESKWFLDTQSIKPSDSRQFVPESCCVMGYHHGNLSPVNGKKCQSFQLGPPRFDVTFASNDAFHMTGCFHKGYTFVMQQSTIVIAVAITFAVCLIIGMILAICIWRLIPPSVYGPTASTVI